MNVIEREPKTILRLTRLFSANAMYASGRGRTFKSGQYRSWIRQSGMELNLQRPKPVSGPYKLTLEAGRPDARVRDADNLLKPLSDLLVSHGIVRDDSDAVETLARWVDGMDGMVVTIEAV